MITGFTVPISHWAHPQHNRGLSEIFHHNNEAIERKTPQKRRKNKHQVPAGYPPRISQRNSAIYIFVPKSRSTSTQSTGPFSIWLTCPIIKMGQLFNFRYVTNIFCHGRWKQKLLFVLSLSLLVPSRVHQGPEFPHSVVGNFRGIMYSWDYQCSDNSLSRHLQTFPSCLHYFPSLISHRCS